jgi:hypothetical protein
MRRLLLPLLPCLLSAQTPAPAHISAFQTTAKAVRKGGTVTLRWSVTGADQVRLDPLGVILPAQGELTHLVTDRTVYWLHVSNAAGGQSVPLVVELLPEEGMPAAPAAPVLVAPMPAAPLVAPDSPKLAAVPLVAPEPPKVAAVPPVRKLPALPPAPSLERVANRLGSRRVWIQFAATGSARGAARLQRKLARVAGGDITVTVRNRRSGRHFQLIRSGPFPTGQAAQLRLQELASALRALNLKPIIILGPPQPVSLGITYVAESRPAR